MPKILRAAASCALLAASCASWGQALEQFLKAVNEGNAKPVAALLGQGLDPNTTDPAGNTALMIASRLGHREVVKVLVEFKASVTRRSPHGDTALMFASLKGHLELAKYLLEKGAQVTHDGWAPLHYAAFEGHGDIAKFLIAKGADRNAFAPNGHTPLMLATRNGHLEAVRTLLYEDVDVGIRSPGGETALKIAIAGKNEELEKLLRRAGAVD